MCSFRKIGAKDSPNQGYKFINPFISATKIFALETISRGKEWDFMGSCGTASLRAISSAYASAENRKLVTGIGHQNPATTGESEENYIKLRGKIKEFDLIKKIVKIFGTDMN